MNVDKKKKVLVVEDEQPILNVIKDKLERRGFDVATARSANQALNLMNDSVKTDIIWLDHYLMDKEDGLFFVSKIKENKDWSSTPIFLVSNTASEDKISTYKELGVERCYMKAEKRLDDIVNNVENRLLL